MATSTSDVRSVAGNDGSSINALHLSRRQINRYPAQRPIRSDDLMKTYFISNDGIGGVATNVTGKQLAKMEVVMIRNDWRKATHAEYRKAVRKANNQGKAS